MSFRPRPPLPRPLRHFRHYGYTLIQLLLVIVIVAGLAAILFPAFSHAQASARRQQCDVKLKSIALALDAFKQEHNAYPSSLQQLQTDGYLREAGALHCPADPNESGTYGDFYVIRAPSDSGEMPVVTCPFHEAVGDAGNQARLGRFTTQFVTRPASLSAANNVWITHPGEDEQVQGYVGMPLHGGDKVLANGSAEITFADNSKALLQSHTTMTVLQSFVDGQSGAPLYTLVKQLTGYATYTVNHGSRFDVATPAVTAGARGTQFIVTVEGSRVQDTNVKVIEGKVVLTTAQKSGMIPPDQVGQWMNGGIIGSLLHGLFG